MGMLFQFQDTQPGWHKSEKSALGHQFQETVFYTKYLLVLEIVFFWQKNILALEIVFWQKKILAPEFFLLQKGTFWF